MTEPAPQLPKRKKAASNKKTGLTKKQLLLALGLFFGIYFFIAKGPASAPRPKAETSPTTLAAKSEETIAAETLTPQIEQANPVVEKKMASGLNEVELMVDEQGIPSIQLVVSQKSVCFPGDLDAIKKVFGANEKLLLSLEAIDKQGSHKPAIASEMVSVDDIKNNRPFKLKIDLKKKGVFGIFLCGDASGSKTCRGKEAAEFNEILNGKKSLNSRDALYYFQFGVIDHFLEMLCCL